MPRWADAINSFIRPDYKPYYGKDTLLDDGSRKSGARNVTGGIRQRTDDPYSWIEQRANSKKPTSMPPRGIKRGRMAGTGRSYKRKAPRAKKRSIKRKAPIRKSSKKKRKVVSKSVPLTVGTTRSRIVDHASVTYTHAAYESFSSIGAKGEFMKPVAEALLLHYMHRVGDYRNNVNTVMMPPTGGVADIAYPVIATWHSMVLKFTSNAYPTDSREDTHIILATAVGSGTAKTLAVMTIDLAGELLDQVKQGRLLASVAMYRNDGTAANCILCDTNAGRNIVQVSSSALLKLQNVTLADSVATGDNAGDRCSVFNIHRNPLNGYAYSFKNCVPVLKEGYKISKTQAQQDVIVPMTDPYATRYAGVSATPTLAAAGQEFIIPPSVPSTIFANVSGKSAASIQPGSHKTFSLKESFNGPINKFFTRYFTPYLGVSVSAVAPGGTSMIIGLKPQYRTSTSEDISLETEHTYTYAARMTRGKMSMMPMQNTLA